MAVIQSRLDEVAADGDWSPVLGRTALAEAAALTKLLRDDTEDLPARNLLGWFHWYRFQARPDDHNRHHLDDAITMFAPCFVAGTGEVPEPIQPYLAELAVPLAVPLLQQAAGSTDRHLVSTAVDVWQRIVRATPADDPHRALRLTRLGVVLGARFALTGVEADLDASIESRRAAVDAAPAGHPDRAECLSQLGMALRTRFDLTQQLSDLDAAIEFRRSAAATAPTVSAYLANLGIALSLRFEQSEKPTDLDEAIKAFRAAVAVTATDDPENVVNLSNLGRHLRARSERTGNLADLDDAIKALRAAAEAIPADDPYRAAQVLTLCDALRSRFERRGELTDLAAIVGILQAEVDTTPIDHQARATMLHLLQGVQRERFERTGAAADLDAMIETCRTVVDATPIGHPNRADHLSDLADALHSRFERTKTQADLDTAIEACEAVVDAIPADDPDRVTRLVNLATSLRERFDRTKAQADLDAVIGNFQTAIDGAPPDDPYRVATLSDVGSALLERFGITRELADLDAAVAALRAAFDSTPGDDPDRAKSLGGIANVLMARFTQAGMLADLNAAIDACQAAVDGTPIGHPNRSGYLSDLGLALRTRFMRTGSLADLDAAVEAGQAAVDDAPSGGADRARALGLLGVALQVRFDHTGVQTDLDAAVEACQAAVDKTPSGDPGRVVYLSYSASALLMRFERAGIREDLKRASGADYDLADLADVYAAIEYFQAAADTMPADHPGRAAILIRLGEALQTRFSRTGARPDLVAAFAAYAQAARLESAPPQARIQAARLAAAVGEGSIPERAALLERAVELLPLITPRYLDRGDQQYAISQFAGLASDAAALALADTSGHAATAERAARALRLLESGRAILLGQALDARDDLTDLHEKHPALARRFVNLRDQLSQLSELSPPGRAASSAVARTGESFLSRSAEDRRHLVGQFNRTLSEIRTLNGFSAFGLPPPTADLLAQAAAGPVVIFNVSRYRSDALLLNETGISSIELPDLDLHALIREATAFHPALRIAANPNISSSGRTKSQARIREVLEWLWDAAAEPVLLALGYASQPTARDEWPHLWWVPGGLLGMLPVHAAGYHAEPPGDHGRRTVIDRVISSYVPTIRSLYYARQHRATTTPGGGALIVAVPTTPGVVGRMHYVPTEVANIAHRLPRAVLLAAPDCPSGELPVVGLPTKANVLARLPGCRIAHFACHSATDPIDPSKSLLLLHDHDRDPLTIASISSVSLDHAELAYLSACGTALSSATDLSDETIHLSSAFHLIGFPHVIGTLWEIDDTIAAEVADAFYRNLRTAEGTLDTSRAGFALHTAIRVVRDRIPRTPSLWAAYIHVGA